MACDFAEASSFKSWCCEAGVGAVVSQPPRGQPIVGCPRLYTPPVFAHLEASTHHAHELPKY